MTTDIKQLRGTERLIRLDCLFDGNPGCACSHCEASDTIARLAAERDRMKAALQPFSDAYERLVRTQESMGFGDNATFGLGIKVSAIKAARKALGGDAS